MITLAPSPCSRVPPAESQSSRSSSNVVWDATQYLAAEVHFSLARTRSLALSYIGDDGRRCDAMQALQANGGHDLSRTSPSDLEPRATVCSRLDTVPTMPRITPSASSLHQVRTSHTRHLLTCKGLWTDNAIERMAVVTVQSFTCARRYKRTSRMPKRSSSASLSPTGSEPRWCNKSTSHSLSPSFSFTVQIVRWSQRTSGEWQARAPRPYCRRWYSNNR